MKLIGLDLGTKTLGIATSDALGLIASPYKVIRFQNDEDLFSELDKVINELKPDKIILGLPKNMDNTIGFAGERSLVFQEKLITRYHTEVILVDERLSTKEAENILINGSVRRDKRKKVIDSVAATIILENYINMKG